MSQYNKSAFLVVVMVSKRRLMVPLPARLERRLILWAYVRSQPSLPSWVSTLLALRVSANWHKIDAELDLEAEHMDMPRSQLETFILEKYGFDFDRELKELENDG